MSAKLFVGGLSWNTTDASLSAFFSQVGQVVSANVIIDRMTGKSKGFGFVEFASEADAKTAIAKLNGQMLDERAIAVSEAKPQAPRSDSFGGGRDSRGGGRGGDRGGFRRDNR